MSNTISPLIWRAAGIKEAPIAEYRFHPVRRFRFDYAWLNALVAVEIEGGIYTNGRHTRGKGYKADMEKYNLATLLGWVILRYTPTDINYKQIAFLINDRLGNKVA